MKLFRVIIYNDSENILGGISDSLVVAENPERAKELVEENIWTLSGMKVRNIEEIKMDEEKFLCRVANIEDLGEPKYNDEELELLEELGLYWRD